MRFLSLFSGIEAASCAWGQLGWECVGFAEVEKFPSQVLAHHYPDVKNFGDITKITEDDIKQLGHIDLIIGGFPCQDLSVAGKRKGLECDITGNKTRSGLFYDAMRIVRWARAHCELRWLLIENVPGLLSSKKGRDFASVVGEICGARFDPPLKGWQNTGVALGSEGLVEWCCLDAQFFSVPQRRIRVFALGDFGDWSSRPPILFERHSLQGHSPPSRKTGEEIAGTLTRGFGSRGVDLDQISGGAYAIHKVAGTLTATYGEQSGQDLSMEGGVQIVCNTAVREVARTLKAKPNNDHREDSDNYVVVHGTQDPCVSDKAFALGRNNGGENVVACFKGGQGSKAGGIGYSEHVAPTLSAAEGGNRTPTLLNGTHVRRLTPVECEKLQGFPMDYTRIQWKGKTAEECPNGHRYKALGNSMAVPVISWIGERIEMMDNLMG